MELTAFATFCDEIRREVSGKTALVGVYGTRFVARKLPVKLERLCVQAQIRLPKEASPNKISLSVFSPGRDEPLSRVVESDVKVPARRGDDKVPYNSFWLVDRIRDVELNEEGLITAVVDVDGQSVFAGALRVLVPKPDSVFQPQEIFDALRFFDGIIKDDASAELCREVAGRIMMDLSKQVSDLPKKEEADILIITVDINTIEVFFRRPIPSRSLVKVFTEDEMGYDVVKQDEVSAVVKFDGPVPDEYTVQIEEVEV